MGMTTNALPLATLTIGAALAGTACSSGSPSNGQVIDSMPDENASIDPEQIDVGERPVELLSRLDDGALKAALSSFDTSTVKRTRFSIAHRGAPLRFAEHSREGYLAAVEQGAGIVECDVTFTKDAEPVCRHSQCDLHTTTNILATDLASALRTSLLRMRPTCLRASTSWPKKASPTSHRRSGCC